MAELRRRLEDRGHASLATLPGRVLAGSECRTTIVVLSWNRLEWTKACIESIVRHVRIPYRLLVVDDGSDGSVRDELAALCARIPAAEVCLLEANRGCGPARQFAAEQAETEYVVFVDNDAEVFPGTVEYLIHALDEHPESAAVGGQIVLPACVLQFCGGDYRINDGVIAFEAMSRGLPFDDPAVVADRCRWIGGTLFASRRSVFERFPIDAGMAVYFEDNEWCHRINQSVPDAFRIEPAAIALHHQISKGRRGSDSEEILRVASFLVPMAHFYAKHGLVMADVFGFVPELTSENRLAAARILLELVAARGPEWIAARWIEGGLAPIFTRPPRRMTVGEAITFAARRLRRLVQRPR